MIHPLVKIITVDGFCTQEQARNLALVVHSLPYDQYEFGKQISNFNLTPEDGNELFSKMLNTSIEVDEDNSGIFRIPDSFIHFESFESMNEWMFVCALEDNTTFNVFEHQSGATTALDGYQFNYRNLFEWDLQINYILKAGQGVLFRPWLFHSFVQGSIQLFRLKEKNGS